MITRPGNKKRAAGLSLAPLAAIAVAFFLPTVRGCDELISPAGFIADTTAAGVLWVLPPYLVGALFFVLTAALLLRRRGPSPMVERIAVAGLIACFASLFMGMSEHFIDGFDDRADVAAVAWLFLAGTIGSICLALALRNRGWARWDGLLASYAALATGMAPVYVAAFANGDLLVGGFVYAASVAGLAVLRSSWVQGLLGGGSGAAKRRPAHGSPVSLE